MTDFLLQVDLVSPIYYTHQLLVQSIEMSKESRLIAAERRNVSFDVEELTNIWDGSKSETEMRRRVERVFSEDPVLKHRSFYSLPRKEAFANATRKSVHVLKNIFPQQGWTLQSPEMRHMHRAQPNDLNLLIHRDVFTVSIRTFGSAEQVEKWVPLCENLNIVGTYAQTELGHGSFLRGLETTADYVETSKEFVMNCPTISAMKWWPGDLGKLANHALVMANLRIKGVKYGMHPFIVQIRDLSTHQPMPVVVGDIGNKFYLNFIGNGFLYMKNVRIPWENLLCKNAEVLPDGTYVKKRSDRMMYASMVSLRVFIPKRDGTNVLAKACTIAVRYSAVRRQGLLNPNGSEVAVMDYVTQQYKLLPQLALTFVSNFAFDQLRMKYERFTQNADKGDLSELAELHALASGLKASVTEQCAEGVEICRRSCGGHGYSHASGLPALLAKAAASCTYEGENTVLYLQTARFLMRSNPNKETQTLFPHMDYKAKVKGNISMMDKIVKCFQLRSLIVTVAASQNLTGMVTQGKTREDAWNICSVQLVNVAKAYMLQYLLSSYARFLTELKCSQPVREILGDLGRLYGLHLINNDAGDFLKTGVLNPQQCDEAYDAEMQLLAKLRPNAVGIVDAFDLSDWSLESCLGVYDGNVYGSLFENAKKYSPLNETEVHMASYQYLRPHLLEGRDILEGAKSKL